ncbi:MAG: hypothetical protein J5685_08780 [Clostridiales bacterium]|nr:hypothetical protein [Clostridiales bacterium]
MFSDRLDFLMKMTDTSNSALGHAVSLDPSYISKIRRGIRKAPKHEEIIDSICDFITKRLTDDKRRGAVSDVVLKGFPLPASPDSVSRVLKLWMLDDSSSKGKETPDLLAEVLKHNKRTAAAEKKKGTSGERGSGVNIYYGNEGKREAAREFLSHAASHAGKAKTILLFSNEDMSWMSESPRFLTEWAGLLSALLAGGTVIKVIHTVTRDLNEMISAVGSWMPLYLRGSIEPYYCPKLRDDIYRRSLFVAPGICAMTSTSVGTNTEGMANMVFYDRSAVDAFAEEFRSYFVLCRSLMKTVREDADTVFLDKLKTLFEKGEPVCTAGAAPLFLTLPEKYLKDVPAKTKKKIESLRSAFTGFLKRGGRIRESFCLPDPGVIDDGGYKIVLWPGKELVYTREIFNDHMKEISGLLAEYGNYSVNLCGVSHGAVGLMASEGGEALLITGYPVMFTFEESNLCSAIYEYIERIRGERDNNKVINALLKASEGK